MFDAWQAQQKAQKDQERKAKTEAAAALQGYRRSGLSEEETKLAALREQERLHKLEAEQQLHGYRSKLTAEEAKLAAEKQDELRRQQEYEEQLRKNGVVSSRDSIALDQNSGVVSALAAEYSSPNKMESSVPTPMKTTPAPLDFSPAMESDPSVVATTDSTSELPVKKNKFVAPDDQNAQTILDSTPAVIPHTVAGEGPLDSTDTSQINTSIVTKTETADSPLASESTTTNVQSSVKFMFGILTAGDVGGEFPVGRAQLVEGYLARTDQIAKSVIVENNSQSSSFESILLSMAYPTASSVKKDETRTDTNRIMVTVTISYSAPDKATSNEFKSQVIERVRAAIAAGTFTKIDR
mmetsp:Transcript_16705/g.38567  ORF Transcript_16705/g.38567 Transcript_16705/m.38567 type:complete len:353 (+) Transcript_16705:191-1249(+)|eukprot:CAMPEP_0197191824 /NCGR_PEP_ID=MMETSP1423-20130617/24070_1 /TAXON_ID=476441 /ORGANISM="Pseudo-nitzschia heimii, Strain UNC1101" /LENGTH=352 /DNA_ID=CAMNT_0042644587 /DNA_START=139 /DNA_END=1197 /DNA_ORIENTATION=+